MKWTWVLLLFGGILIGAIGAGIGNDRVMVRTGNVSVLIVALCAK